MNMIERLKVEYGDPLVHIDRIPRTATELFYAWTGVAPEKTLNRRERHQRRWLAKYLEKLSWKGTITRGVAIENGYRYIAFWRDAVDTDAARSDRPRGTAAGGEDRGRDGRGVGQ